MRWLHALLITLLSLLNLYSKPDIVLFLTDDHGRLDSSPYGAKDIPTPQMQRLADEGMTFDRAYVSSPSCAPSRASLLTGLMPARSGAEVNHSKPKLELKKWPAYFQELGYEVVAFGKVSHYQHTKDYGFDHFAHDTFHDHAGIGAAVDFLKNRPRQGAKPLCLLVGSNWPHVPWPEHSRFDPAKVNLPAGSIDTPETRQWRARYVTAVSNGDRQLGRIMEATRQYLSPEAVFLFSSDHGAQWPFGKWNLYESGVAVPLIVVWPGVTKAGSRSSAMVQWTDFLPTLLEVAGGKAPSTLDGRSFVEVLRGSRDTHQERLFTTHSGDGRMNIFPMRAVREGDWKYIRNVHPEYAFTSHLDLGGAKGGQRAFFSTWEKAAQLDPKAASILDRYHRRPAEELYDLKSDPEEQRNLANETSQADRLAALRQTLDDWLKNQGDTLKTPSEPRLLSDPKSFGPAAALEIK